jgi:hypothetical protein
MDKKHLHTLLFRFFGNDFPEDVRNRFATWFIRSEQVSEKEEVLEEIWESLPVTMDFDSYAELKKVNKRIHSGQNHFYRRLAVVAAIIIFPLLGILATTWYYEYSEMSQGVHILECFVPNGERKQVTLPDGSTVWLNANSVLIYPEKFGKTRTLFLSGEGHFTVTKDKERPFIVKTNYLNVEALGTVFNVHSYPEENETTTILESGKVRVDDKIGSSGSVILNPNEQLIYNHVDASFFKCSVDAFRLSSWTKGYLIFQQETLEGIFRALERQYNVKINYNDTKFKNMTFTVRFHARESLEEALDVLKRIGVNFKYKIVDNDVYIQ